MTKKLLSFALILSLTGCEIIVKPTPPPNPAGPEIASVLLQLIDAQEKGTILSSKDYDSTSLKDLITLGTPAGYRIALRYTEIGVPMVESLKLSRDKTLLARLFELSQWSGNDRVRAEALTTAASFSDPDDLQYIQTALADQNSTGLRLAAIEALELWGLPEGRSYLKSLMTNPWSPLARVLSAKAILAQGDESGLPVLRQLIADRSWIIRAMAAHYLGDYGRAEDFKTVLTALNQETQNNFAMAEFAIASLKLLPKATPSAATRAPQPKPSDESGKGKVAYQVREGAVEMAPLVLKPPRLKLDDKTLTAQTINNKLLDLIQNRLDVPLSNAEKNDSNLQDLYQMVTPLGFALQTRYSQLSVLVAEGLAGTTDPFLRSRLAQLARSSTNPLTRATSILSLGYGRNPEDEGIISDGLNDNDPIVRFGALEALQAGQLTQFTSSLVTVATSDPVPAFRLFAMQNLIQWGYGGARNLLLAQIDNTDWPARAMAFWYLGRYGDDRDIDLVRSRIGTEQNPFVLAEIVLATERLAPAN